MKTLKKEVREGRLRGIKETPFNGDDGVAVEKEVIKGVGKERKNSREKGVSIKEVPRSREEKNMGGKGETETLRLWWKKERGGN